MSEKNETRTSVICKSAEVQTKDVSEEDLRKINKFTLSPLTAEEVFTFKVVMGDNETDDRNYEPFSLSALKDLKKLYVGKTVIKDHARTADGQVARIYDTELITESKQTKAGEPFTKLIAYCYMVKTASNADLITEIKAGIKKEVSTSCTPKKAICSICGKDNMKEYCSHWYGKEYAKADGTMAICYFTLDGAKEAYELSLVAVPAQKRAGTCKTYTGKAVEEKDFSQTPDPETNPENQSNKDSENDACADARIKALESFIFVETQKEEK